MDALEQPLEEPGPILEVLLGGLQRGQPVRDAWAAFHRAAVRDEKLSEVAFAYEAAVSDKRWSKLPPVQLAEVLLQAGVFFESCFGDPEGAESYLERLVKIAPAHPEGFARLEKLLLRRQAAERLSDLYMAAAGASEKGLQKELFQKAAAAAESMARSASLPPPGASQPPPSAKPRPLGKGEERMLAAYQQIVKLDPSDTVAWKSLETLLRRSGRSAELAKLLEQRLTAGLEGDEETDMREQLVGIYESLREPERAVPHAEVVLSRRPESLVARRAAEALVSHRVLGPRAGLALAAAFEGLGQSSEAAVVLQSMLELLRGPKRLEVQRRLATLRFEVLGDLAGAHALFGEVVLGDPADDEARRKYVQLSDALGKTQDAVRVLGRALAAAREPETKAMLQLDLGSAMAQLARGLTGPAARSELRRAAAALSAAMEGATSPAAIAAAARAARGVAEGLDDSALLAAALERLGQHDEDEEARLRARLELAGLRVGAQGDPKAAVPILRSLFDTPLEREALAALEPLLDAEADPLALAEVLGRRAALETDLGTAERISLRLLDLRAKLTGSKLETIAALRTHLERFGPSLELLGRLTAALEAEKDWGALADALLAQAELATGPARAQALVRRGQVQEKRLGREPDALESFAGALEADPTDRPARAAVERYLRHEGPAELSLAAADRLEELLRAEGGAALQRLLDVRGALAPTPALRLAALRELVDLPQASRDPKHALWVAVEGLACAIAGAADEVEAWSTRVERVTDADPRARAEALSSAAGEAPHEALDGAAWLALVCRAGEAFARLGDAGAALAAFRRALAREPESAELIARMEELLAEQGTAQDRLALYQNLLKTAHGARRASVLHKIGRLQRHDLEEPGAALETYQLLRAEVPGDLEARSAVLDLLAGRPDELLVVLEEERAALGAAGEGVELDERIGVVAQSLGRTARAVDAYALALASGAISDAGLLAAEELGRAASPSLRVAALQARLARSVAPADEIDARVQLSEALAATGAAEGDIRAELVRAAHVSEEALDDPARAIELFELAIARGAAGGDAPPELVDAATGELVRLLAASDDRARLARAHASRVQVAASEELAASRLAALDDAVSGALGPRAVEAAREAWLAGRTASGVELELVVARALARDPARADDAARLMRETAERSPATDVRALGQLEGFVADRRERHDDREWLLRRAAERAQAPSERVVALVRLARFVGDERSDAPRAAGILQEAMQLGGPDDEALVERARFCELAGMGAEATQSLLALADRRAGPERAALLSRVATLELASGRAAELGPLLQELARLVGIAGGAGRELASRLLAEPTSSGVAEEALERWAREEAEAVGAAAALDLLLEKATQAPEARRAAWYERRIELAADDEEALTLALRALAEQPVAFGLWDRAEALARTCQKEPDLAQAYRRALDSSATVREEAFEELVGRAISFHDDVLGDPEASTSLLRRVVEHEFARPAEDGAELPAAFDRLVVVYSGREQWNDLFALYDLALGWLRTVARRVDLLRDASEVARDVAHDIERAVRYMRELVRLRPDARVRASLERLLERTGRQAELVELLDEQAAATQGHAAATARVRAATLALEGVGDAAGAMARLEQIEAVSWSDEAIVVDATALLERVLGADGADGADRLIGAGDGASSSPRLRAAKLLAARYRARGREAELLRALSVWLESDELGLGDDASSARRASVLDEVIELARKLGDEPRLALALADALVTTPNDAAASEVERMLLARGELLALGETLLRAARRPTPAETAKLLLARAASAFEELPEGLATAIELRRELATLAEGDPNELLLAVRKLDRLLERAGRTQDLCAVLERLATLESDPSEKRRALVELTRLSSSLGDHEATLRALRGRLEADPSDTEAADLRIELLGSRVAPGPSAVALDGDGTLARELAEGLLERGGEADLMRGAALLERLGEAARAASVWRSILANRRAAEGADPAGEDAAVDALAEVLTRSESFTELVEHLEEAAARATDRARTAALHARIGAIQLHSLGRPGEALDALARGLGLGDVSSIDAIEELVTHVSGRLTGPDPELRAVLARASRLLLGAYVEHDRLERSRWLLERRREAASDDVERAAAEIETARFLAEHAAPTSRGAASLYAEALRRHPTEEVAREAARMISAGQELHAVERFGAVLAAPSVEVALSPAVLAELRLGVVRAALAHDGGVDVATRVLVHALGAAPADVELRLAGVDVERRRGSSMAIRGALLHAAEVVRPGLTLLREAAELSLPLPEGAREALLLLYGRAKEEAATTEGVAEAVEQALWAVERLSALGGDAPEVDAASRRSLLLEVAELPVSDGTRLDLLIRAAQSSPPEQATALYERLLAGHPTDERVALPLARLYRAQGRLRELAELTRGRLQTVTSPQARAGLSADLSDQLVELGALDEAERVLRAALGEAGPNEGLARRLVDVLRKLGRMEDVVAFWEGHAAELQALGRGKEAAIAWQRAASLAQSELSDLPRAAVALRLASKEGSLEAFDPLARLLLKMGEAAEAAGVLERLWLEAPELAGEAGALLLAEAHTAAGAPKRAAERLEEARARGLASDRLLGQLAGLHRANHDLQPLARVLVAQADLTTEPARRLELLVEAGKLELGLASDEGGASTREERVASAKRAAELLDRALDLGPQELTVRLLRERALVASGDVESARQNLRALVERAVTRRPRERAALHHELARVHLAAGDREAALAELDTALRADPTDVDSLVVLARVSRDIGQLDRSQRAYRSLLVVLKKHAPTPRAAQAQPAVESAVVSITRSEVLLALSEIAELSGEPERATEYLESAFDAATGSPEQPRFFAALRQRGRHDLLVRALAAEVETADPSAQPALLRSLAQALEAAGKVEECARVYLRALDAIGPELPLALATLRASLAAGRVGPLLARLAGAPPGVRLSVAEVLLETDPGNANLLLEKIEPTEELALRLLRVRVRAARTEGDAAREAAALHGLLEASGLPEQERLDGSWRLAELNFSHLADAAEPTEALAALERAWDAEPRPGVAFGLLRGVIARGERAPAVLQLFERCSRVAEDREALIEALLLRAGAEGELAPLREAIELAEQLGQLPSIEERLRSRLASLAGPPASTGGSAPDGDGDEWAVEAPARSLGPEERAIAPLVHATLARIRRDAGDPAGEARALEGLAPYELDPKATLLRVAELAAGPLADLPRAARIYDGLHDKEPGARDVWEPMLAVARRLGDAARLDARLAEVVAYIDEPRERAQILLERARAKASDEARELLQSALEEDPTLTDAAVALAELLEARGESEALVTLLSRQLDVAKDREDVPAIESLSSRIAELAEKRGDVSTALEAWHGVLDWNAEHLGALRAIARLSERSETTLDLSDALDRLLRAESGKPAADVALRLAELEVARGADERGLEALETGFSRSHGDRRLRKELAARYALERRLDKLAGLAEAEAGWIDADRGPERAAKLLEAAEILLDPDAGRCFEIVRRALVADPRSARALELLGDLGLELGRAEDALETLDVAAMRVSSPELLRRRASLRNAAGRQDEALDDLEAAYAETGDGAEELAFQLEQKLARLSLGGGGEESFAKTQSRLADLYLSTGQLDAARAILGDVLRRSPKERDALRSLAALETKAERWDAAVAAYRRLISVEEGEALLTTALAFADACERGGRLSDARGGLERALRAAPGEPKVRARLREVYEALEAHVELAQMIGEDAEASESPADRFALLLKAARLLVEPEPERALEVLEKARALRPADDDVTLVTAAARARSGAVDEARALLSQAAHAKGRRAKAAAPLFEALGRLELQAGNLSEALEAHTRAFECDSQSAAIALALALLALDLDDQDAATRSLRAVTLMKVGTKAGEGATAQQRGLAYHHLAALTLKQGDARRAKVYVEKALADDPNLADARELLLRLK